MSKILYAFNEDGLYIGVHNCQLDPEETKIQGKEVYLIPPYTTELEPLPHKDGYHVKFIDGKWQYILDRHAEEIHKMNALAIKNEFGVPLNKLDENNNVVPMSEQEIIDMTKQAKLEIVRKMREPLLHQVDVMINEVILFGLPIEVIEQIKVYRQALLDITNGIDHATDINALVWPTSPNYV